MGGDGVGFFQICSKEEAPFKLDNPSIRSRLELLKIGFGFPNNFGPGAATRRGSFGIPAFLEDHSNGRWPRFRHSFLVVTIARTG